MKKTLEKIIEKIKAFSLRIYNYAKSHPKSTLALSSIIIVSLVLIGAKIFTYSSKEQYIPILSVKAITNDNILANNSTFIIETDLNYDIDEVKKIIFLEPAIEYEVKKIASKKYEITPIEILSDNTVYSVGAVRDETIVYRWAFQTEKKLSISSTYPRDGYEYAPLKTSIEITFSYPDLENIEEYFEISPQVEGKFVKEKYTYKFIPAKELSSDTEYTITIKKGLKNDFSTLEEDYIFSFRTSWDSNQKNTWVEYNYENIDDAYTYTSDIIPVIKLDRPENVSNAEVSIYRLNSIDEYINNYKNKTQIDYSKLSKHSSFNTSITGDFVVFQNTLEEGYYIVKLTVNNQSFDVFIQINNLVTYVTNLENETLVWVNDYKTGKPAKDLVANLNGNESKTDSDGIAIVKAKSNEEKYTHLKVGTNKNTPYAVMINNYENNVYPSVYVYSDRTVYKKTDTIKVWGYVPLNNFNGTPKDNFKINIGTWSETYISKDITVNSNGLFETEILISDYKEGSYNISLTYQDAYLGGRYVEIYDYEKPNYTYTIKTDKNFYNIGEVINAEVEVEHISGIKVPNKKVTVIDDYGIAHNIKTDENGKATLKVNIKTSTTSQSVYLNYFQLKISSGDIEETSNYAEVTTVGVVNHTVVLDVIQKTENSIQINTYKTDANKLNAKYENYSYYIPEREYWGDSVNQKVTVQIEERTTTKTLKGTKYNPITKTNEPKYEYDYSDKIIDTHYLDTINGEVVLSDLNYKNITEEEYNKTYYAIITTVDTYNNPLKEYIFIGDYGTTEYYMNDYYDIFYSFSVDKSEYNLNDSINIKLEGKEGYTVDEGRILSYFYKYGITTKKISENNDITYKYNTDIFPDALLSGAYFDGKRIYKVENRVVGYNEKEQELSIDIKTDKDTVSPGSEITINIDVKDANGKGKKSSVNISVVDEAVFLINPDTTDILENIYRQNYYHYYSFASYFDFNTTGGGMGDTGGGPDNSRKDFRDTAYFQTITTDANGKATVKVKLPDSTTTWRITAHAISDTYVGVSTKKVNATLPFFIQTTIPNAIKPTDDFVINLSSFGVSSGKVKYEVLVDDIKQNKEGKIGDITAFNFGKLSVGTHKIKINGNLGSSKDTLEYEFVVLESFVNIPITNIDYITNGKLDINAVTSPVILEFYDTELEFYMKLLDYLENTNGERVDLELANQKALELKNKYYEEKSDINIIKLNQYQTDKGITLLKGDSPSILLSSLMSKYAKKYIDVNELSENFYTIINNEKSSEKDVYEAYIGLAALKEPILFDLHYLKNQERTDVNISIYLALAYAFLGDYTTALEIYNQEIKANEKSPEFLLAILTSMIDIQTSKVIINNNLENDEFNEYYTFAIISYIENTIPLLDKKNTINIDLNGSKETIELNKMMIKKLVITKEDLDNIKIQTSNNVYVKTIYNGNYKDINESDLKYTVSSTISNKIKKGSVTKLTITIDNMEPKTWGTVEIHLPNGLKLSPEYISKNQVYLTKNLNDYLVFNVYNKNSNSITFDIDLIGINVGEFELEPVIFISDNKYGISNSNNITIEK